MPVSPKAPTFGAVAKNLPEPIYKAVMCRMRRFQTPGVACPIIMVHNELTLSRS